LPKPERGRYPRPTVRETLEYREIIEKQIVSFLTDPKSNIYESEHIQYDIMLANQHEMQHQELMIYDLQHYFQRFPSPRDNYNPAIRREPPSQSEDPDQEMVVVPGGIFEMGFKYTGFCYDNELPEHKVYLQSYKIDTAPVTNAQFIEFINDGGYCEYKYWLADGWDKVVEDGWNSPLYWQYNSDTKTWMKKDLRGFAKINQDEPVVNLSYYEADAYARWAKKRLPTEAEWEKAASWNEDLQKKTRFPWGDSLPTPRLANLMDSNIWGPTKIGSYPEGKSHYGCHQMIGDVWEWTSSEYTLYPGFKPKFSEYTDKWAINQKVLRGGCFATPNLQIRNSYRNYFKPHERILFAGFRCVRDL
jgi:ergothioneine biosynthesis protein EgtB